MGKESWATLNLFLLKWIQIQRSQLIPQLIRLRIHREEDQNPRS